MNKLDRFTNYVYKNRYFFFASSVCSFLAIVGFGVSGFRKGLPAEKGMTINEIISGLTTPKGFITFLVASFILGILFEQANRVKSK